jgi:hypothetical protein
MDELHSLEVPIEGPAIDGATFAPTAVDPPRARVSRRRAAVMVVAALVTGVLAGVAVHERRADAAATRAGHGAFVTHRAAVRDLHDARAALASSLDLSARQLSAVGTSLPLADRLANLDEVELQLIREALDAIRSGHLDTLDLDIQMGVAVEDEYNALVDQFDTQSSSVPAGNGEAASR